MRHPLKQLGLVLACAGFGLTASAQQTSGFDVQFKLRTGYQVLAATDPDLTKDHLTRRTIGFGVEAGYSFSWGRLGLELGYQSKPGDAYNNGLSDVTPYDSNTVILPYGNGGYFTTGDVRRNSLEGMTVRLSYETNTGSDWAFRGGIQLGGAKFRHEYFGNTYGVNTAANDDFLDTYQGTPTKSTLALSPFIGVSYKINEQNSLELNLIGIAYKSINYHHVAGTGLWSDVGYGGNTSLDYLTENRRMVPHLEIGYAFRF